MLFFLDYLLISQKSVSLHCVFHSIRFKVNKGWSKALLLFLCPYVSFQFYIRRTILSLMINVESYFFSAKYTPNTMQPAPIKVIKVICSLRISTEAIIVTNGLR